ncbi:hypothetical protein CEXT_216251 [Caerostris extrusa]|uniref:Transposase n=1 Tax=Caerostris extrusa TaxID=172846 RepID=A0AAV4U9K8_CAEEX|nr:hypothetical protein CEXT_216251 [Caerostris extrusa]
MKRKGGRLEIRGLMRETGTGAKDPTTTVVLPVGRFQGDESFRQRFASDHQTAKMQLSTVVLDLCLSPETVVCAVDVGRESVRCFGTKVKCHLWLRLGFEREKKSIRVEV